VRDGLGRRIAVGRAFVRPCLANRFVDARSMWYNGLVWGLYNICNLSKGNGRGLKVIM